jgi:hypothetical protein
MLELNKCALDMATAIKTTRTFGGSVSEDVGRWLRDALLIAEIAELSDGQTVKLLLVSLRDAAMAWASQTFGGKPIIIGKDELVELMKKRFGAMQHTDVTLSRFISASVLTTRDEFTALCRDGTMLFEKGLMKESALFQLIVGKAPLEIKGLLYEKACVSNTWDDFVRIAEEIAWIAFPDSVLSLGRTINASFVCKILQL